MLRTRSEEVLYVLAGDRTFPSCLPNGALNDCEYFGLLEQVYKDQSQWSLGNPVDMLTVTNEGVANARAADNSVLLQPRRPSEYNNFAIFKCSLISPCDR